MQQSQDKNGRLTSWFLKHHVPVVVITLLFIVMMMLEYDLGYSLTRVFLILIIFLIVRKISR